MGRAPPLLDQSPVSSRAACWCGRYSHFEGYVSADQACLPSVVGWRSFFGGLSARVNRTSEVDDKRQNWLLQLSG